MEKLSFYDVKAKRKFMSSNYTIKVKNGRRFAVAKAPSGIMSWRILGMASKTKKKPMKRRKR